jgi:hypothetical protein
VLFPKWRTITRRLSIIRRRYFLTRDERLLHGHFAQKPRKDAANAPISITVEAGEDHFYFFLFGTIASALASKQSLRVDQYILRSLRPGSSMSIRALLWIILHYNFLSDLKWKRLYGSFADGVAWRAAASFAPWKEVKFYVQAWRIWHRLQSLDALLALNIRGITVGDLIVDSYIRFKPAPEVVLNDPYLLVVLRQALKDLDNAIGYFSRVRPKLYLTSYTSYIQHGIPARVATSFGTKIFSFGNYQTLSKPITAEDWCHVSNGANYKSDFLALPDQDAKLQLAEREFSAVTQGQGSSAAYLQHPVPGSGRPSDVNVKGMPVIFLHDFFDSVHCYRWITFHDFWTWICFTIETFQKNGIAFAIKPHPEQVDESRDLVTLLREKYLGLQMIPVETNNRTLIQSGMSCAVTFYGTVSAEMAFLGVPSISCGDNPHVAFDFSNTARTPEEYKNLLRNCQSLPRDIAKMRQECCMFYYMHNLNLSQQERRLSDDSLALRQLMYSAPVPPAPAIVKAFSDFEASSEFHIFMGELSSYLT